MTLYARIARSSDGRFAPKAGILAEPGQTRNLAGGFSWEKNDLVRLRDFLILGTEGGTFYAGETELTLQNIGIVLKMVSDPRTAESAFSLIAEIGRSNRAPKHSPVLYALSVGIRSGAPGYKARFARLAAELCRTGSHLFELFSYLDAERAVGQTYKTAARAWYAHADRDPKWFAYQALKYQDRYGWNHDRIMRLTHPKFSSPTANAVAHWIAKGWDSVGPEEHPVEALRQIWAFELIKHRSSIDPIIGAINSYGLTREMVPTQFLKNRYVLRALLEKMPITATIRSLGPMTANGVFEGEVGRENVKMVVDRLGDADVLTKGRVHPVNVLLATKQYTYGHGLKGSLTWEPVDKIAEAMNEAFYLAYGSVTPTGKSVCYAVDVSGSMHGNCSGSPLVYNHEAAGAMMLPLLRVEPDAQALAFSSTGNLRSQKGYQTVDVRGRRLDDAVAVFRSLGGGTDLSLPIKYALDTKQSFDAFVIFTDSETWAGDDSISTRLREYRKSHPDVKLVICATAATKTTVCDPNDANQLGIAGFDAAVPSLVHAFLTDSPTTNEEEDF